MEKECGINWKNIRSVLTSKLDNNPLFQAFNLYDHSSSEDIDSYYLEELSKSDLVIFLIGPFVRKGTYKEFEKAIQLSKKHMFFFDDKFLKQDPLVDKQGVEMSAKEFIQKTDKKDFGVYRQLSLTNFDSGKVMTDILNEVQRDFSKYSNVESIPESKDTSVDYKTLVSEISLPSITVSPNMLKNIIFREKRDLPKKPTFPFKIFDYLINGSDFPNVSEYKSIFSTTSDLKPLIPLLTERWNAIISYMHGEYGEALEHEREALNLTDTIKVPEWLKRDLLIDCRNIFSKKEPLNFNKNKFQAKLISNSKKAFYPILDRYKSDLLELFMDEMGKYELQKQGTINWGSFLPIILNKLQDYLLVATLFGSLTYINQAREFLSKILMNYGNVFKDPDTIILAIKLYFLNGEDTIAINVINKYWSSIGSRFLIDLHDIFKVFNSKNCIDRKRGSLAFISVFGYDLTEEELIIAKTDLINIIDEDSSSYYSQYISKAFIKLSLKLTPNEILTIANKIMDNKKLFEVYPYISRALVTHKITEYDVPKLSELLKELKVIISKTDYFNFSFLLPFIDKKSQISTQIIANLNDIILKNSDPWYISFQKLENNNDLFNMTNFLLSLKDSLKDWTNKVSAQGTISASSSQLDLINYELLHRKQTQGDINELAKIMYDPINIALVSSNEFTIKHIFNTLITMFESIFINKLEIPKNILWLKEKTIPITDDYSKNFNNNIDSIHNMFLSVKAIILNSNDNWLSILSKQNEESVREYSLKIFQEAKLTNSINPQYVNLINNWLKSDNENVVLASLPIAIYALLVYHSFGLVENISNLSGSIYPNIKISTLSLLLRFIDYKNTKEFKSICNDFCNDHNWKVRNLVEIIENKFDV